MKNLGLAKMVENHEILDCLRENRVFRNFGGPAGGSALGRASLPLAGKEKRKRERV